MDDVSRFQKITSIAREMIEKGQASSMQEAMRIAEKQIDEPHEEAPAKIAPVESDQKITPETAPPVEPAPEQQAEQPAPDAPAEHPAPEQPAPTAQPAPVPEAKPPENVQSEIGQQTVMINKIVGTVNAQTEKIQDIEKKMNAIIADLAGLKDEIRRLKENPVTAPPLKPKAASAGQTQFKEEANPATAAAEVKSESKGSGGHVRSGAYNSDDVSIEKFFYYGNR